jgi:uncharacterized membrane protein
MLWTVAPGLAARRLLKERTGQSLPLRRVVSISLSQVVLLAALVWSLVAREWAAIMIVSILLLAFGLVWMLLVPRSLERAFSRRSGQGEERV